MACAAVLGGNEGAELVPRRASTVNSHLQTAAIAKSRRECKGQNFVRRRERAEERGCKVKQAPSRRLWGRLPVRRDGGQRPTPVVAFPHVSPDPIRGNFADTCICCGLKNCLSLVKQRGGQRLLLPLCFPSSNGHVCLRESSRICLKNSPERGLGS